MTDVTRGSREWQQRFMRGLEWGVGDIADALMDEGNVIIAREAVDTSALLKSSEIQRAGRYVRLIKWTAKHAPYAHYGSRPHWPPLKPILEWVKRNARLMDDGNVGFKAGGTGGRRLSGSKTREQLALRVARAVQAKIARDGTKGVFWGTRAADIVRPKASAMVEAAVQRSLRAGGDVLGG